MTGFVPPEQVPGEQVLWSRELRRGLIQKRVVMREGVTNKRIYMYNLETGQLNEVAMADNFDVLVEDERRNSEGAVGGLYGGGMFYGRRAGRSWSIGTVLIMAGGVARMKFSNVTDPRDLKQLIDTIRREEKQQWIKGPLRENQGYSKT